MAALHNSDLEKLAVDFEKSTDEFLTMHWRPVYADKNLSVSDQPLKRKTCIVMQGPLLDFKDFTFETIKLYNKIFPSVDVILSTWNTENLWGLEKMTSLGLTQVELT